MDTDRTPTLAAMAALAAGAVDVSSFATPDAIEATQRAASADLIARFDRLPARLENRDDEPSRAFLEAHGFRILGEAGPLYLGVVPPAGWTLRDAWTDTVLEAVDAEGHVRFNLMHKVAAYDPVAAIRPVPRYRLAIEWLDAGGLPTQERRLPGCVAIRWTVADATGPVPFRGVAIPTIDFRTATPEENRAYCAATDAGEAAAKAWLDAHRPAWRDPARSWTDPQA